MASKAYIYTVASRLDLNASSSLRVNSDGVKLVACRIGKEISDTAIQVLGGNGYVAEYEVSTLKVTLWSLNVCVGGETLEGCQVT